MESSLPRIANINRRELKITLSIITIVKSTSKNVGLIPVPASRMRVQIDPDVIRKVETIESTLNNNFLLSNFATILALINRSSPKSYTPEKIHLSKLISFYSQYGSKSPFKNIFKKS